MILRFLFILLFSVHGFGATYYVSWDHGDDATNNGLGPDASDGTNRPWKTLGKALGASGISSGDTVHVAPGTQREVVTAAMTSATVETLVLGDPRNVQGFKSSGGVLAQPGEVRWSAFTTSDTTAPSSSPVLTLSARDFLTFRDIVFVTGAVGISAGAHSTDIKIDRCVFLHGGTPGNRTLDVTATAGSSLGWTITNCRFAMGSATGGLYFSAGAGSADYDLQVEIRNCLFMGPNGGFVRLVGAASNKPGGIDIISCTFIGQSASLLISTGSSTSIPCVVENCYLYGTPLQATATGEIVEDYNIIFAATPRVFTSIGANSVSNGSYANLFSMGQEALLGFQSKPFGTPSIGSPLLGFGGSLPATTDAINRPRPSGGSSTNYSVGYLERHDFGAKETSVTDASGTALKLVGPGDHDIRVPVNATSTTLTIRVRFDTNHGTTYKPQAILLAAPEIGVSTETETAAGSADTWETLTFSSFTPTSKGWVTLRLVSRSETGNGIAYFDTLTQ